MSGKYPRESRFGKSLFGQCAFAQPFSRPTSIFAADDVMAVAVIDTLRVSGVIRPCGVTAR